MNAKVIVTTELSELSGRNEYNTDKHHSHCHDILPADVSGHITNTNMNDMPSESYQKSLVLENWTSNIDVECPSTETQSCKSDGTCSESSLHFLRLSSDSEDSVINDDDTCDIFDNECSRDTIMCIDKIDSNKNENLYDKLTIKSLEESSENETISSLTDVNNWKELFQVNHEDQHISSNRSIPMKDSLNRATVVKLTPLKDNNVNNFKPAENYDNHVQNFPENYKYEIEKEPYLSPKLNCEKLVQENKAKVSNYKSHYCLRKNENNIKNFVKRKYFIKRKKSFYSSHHKFPFKHKNKRKRRKRIQQRYMHEKDSEDHNYSCIKAYELNLIQSTSSSFEETCSKIFEENFSENKSLMQNCDVKLSENSLTKTTKSETEDDTDFKLILESSEISSKSLGERQMPILITYDDDNTEECSPSSPQMPTLIPFTSENEHPLVVFNDDYTSNYHYKQHLPNENSFYNVTISNKALSSSSSSHNGNQWSHTSDCFSFREKSDYRYINKFSRKARKSFPRARCCKQLNFLNSARTSGTSSFNSCTSNINFENKNQRLQSSPNFQPVVLLERIKSESPTKHPDKESLIHCGEEFYNYFNYSTNTINEINDPEIDIIDGVEFFSFVSEQNLQRFVKTNHTLHSDSNNNNCNECENQKTKGAIVPTKTNDITRIKGWRNKLFVQEPCPPPPSYTSWEHLMHKDLTSDQGLNALPDTKNETLQEDKKVKISKLNGQNEPHYIQNCSAGKSEEKSIFKDTKTHTETKTSVEKTLKQTVSKSSRSAFMSNILDDFLKTRSKLSINMLTQYNPNILSIPENSPILSVGSLRKSDESLPSEMRYSNKENMSSYKVARMGINKKITKKNEDQITLEIPNEIVLSQKSETSSSSNLKQKDAKSNITYKNKINTKSNLKQTRFKESAEVHDNVQTYTKNVQKLKSNYSDITEDDILKSNDKAVISLLSNKLLLIQQTLWNNEIDDYKKVVQFLNKVNIDEANCIYSEKVQESFPIIEESFAEEAIKTLITSETLNICKNPQTVLQCGSQTKNTHLSKSKSENKNFVEKKEFLAKSNNKYIPCEKSKISKKLEQTQATRSKRLIRLPARYKDSAVSITGNELWDSPYPFEENKQKIKRKSDCSDSKNLISKKVCIPQNNRKSKLQQNKTLISLLENNYSSLYEKYSISKNQNSTNTKVNDFVRSVVPTSQKLESVFTEECLSNNKNDLITSRKSSDPLSTSLSTEKVDVQFGQDGKCASHQYRIENKMTVKNNSHIFIKNENAKVSPVLYEIDCKDLLSNNQTTELLQVSNVQKTESVNNQNLQILNVTVSDTQENHVKLKNSTHSDIPNDDKSLMLNVLVGNKIVPMKLVPFSVSPVNLVDNSEPALKTQFLLPQTVPQPQTVPNNIAIDHSNGAFNLLQPLNNMTDISKEYNNPSRIGNHKTQQEIIIQNQFQNSNDSVTIMTQATTHLNSVSNSSHINNNNLSPNGNLNSFEVQLPKNKWQPQNTKLISQNKESSNVNNSNSVYMSVSSKENLNSVPSNSLFTENSNISFTSNSETVDRINSNHISLINQSESFGFEGNGNIDKNHIRNFHSNNNDNNHCNDNKQFIYSKEYNDTANKRTEIQSCNDVEILENSNVKLKSDRARKQTKTCNLLCCNDERKIRREKCQFQREERKTHVHKNQKITNSDIVHSWSFSDKQHDSCSSEDDNMLGNGIKDVERRKNLNDLLDTLSSDQASPSREVLEKYSTSDILHTAATHVSNLTSTFHQLEREKQKLKATKKNLLKKYITLMNGLPGKERTFQKINKEIKDKIPLNNNKEFIKVSEENSGKIMSMKFTGERLASLKSCKKETNNKIFKESHESKPKVDLNQLLAAAGEICGPCVVKRVQLKNGQTVYVYKPLSENDHSELKCTESDSIQTRIGVSDNPECMREIFVNSENLTVPFSQLSENLLPVMQQQIPSPTGREFSIAEDMDNNNSTTLWLTGNGEPCYVTKLSPEQNVDWSEDLPTISSFKKESEDISDIINCTTNGKEHLQELGNIQNIKDEQVLNISQ